MWSNEKGISIVETVIAMALLSLAISLGSGVMNNQIIARNIRKQLASIRILAIQATQEVTLNYKFYPPIDTGVPGEQALYVACYSGAGDLVPNAITKSRDYQFMIKSDYKDDESTGACSKDSAAYEVRFYWESPIDTSVIVNIFYLQKKSKDPAMLTSRNFKIFAK